LAGELYAIQQTVGRVKKVNKPTFDSLMLSKECPFIPFLVDFTAPAAAIKSLPFSQTLSNVRFASYGL
jgi:hypothetical protein